MAAWLTEKFSRLKLSYDPANSIGTFEALECLGNAMTESLHIGTSGFTAAGWSGTCFPRKLPARDYLSYYASRFNTIELMSTL
jgi:hypothetical protein